MSRSRQWKEASARPVVVGAWAWLTVAFLLFGGAAWARGGEEPTLEGSPAVRKVRLRSGTRQDFTVVTADVWCAWRLDGRMLPTRSASWTFAPTPAQVGTHTLVVTVRGERGLERRSWAVRVDPPRPPRVVSAAPAAPRVEVGPGESIVLAMRTAAAATGESVYTAWTVDGEAAGEGEELRLAPSHGGTIRARALAIGSHGAAVAREWEVVVRPTAVAARTSTTTVVPSRPLLPTTSTVAGQGLASVTPAPPAVPPRPVAPRATVPPPVAAPAPEVSADDVRALLSQYAAAWNRRDVDTLRRLGQFGTDAQEAALRGYFSQANDLNVEVQLLEMTTSGTRQIVRFTRRDRFRDPSGRLITQETPPIEKEVVRGAGGLRFVAPSR